MSDEIKHKIGTLVYVVADQDCRPRMVTGIMIRPHGHLYYVSDGEGNEQPFWDIEISSNPVRVFP